MTQCNLGHTSDNIAFIQRSKG